MADFAADMRAGTPSMAAELVVPDWRLLYQKIDEMKMNTNKYINIIMRHKSDVLNGYLSSGFLQDSSKLLAAYSLALDQDILNWKMQ